MKFESTLRISIRHFHCCQAEAKLPEDNAFSLISVHLLLSRRLHMHTTFAHHSPSLAPVHLPTHLLAAVHTMTISEDLALKEFWFSKNGRKQHFSTGGCQRKTTEVICILIIS
jgi:hypothetical protein